MTFWTGMEAVLVCLPGAAERVGKDGEGGGVKEDLGEDREEGVDPCREGEASP